MINAIILSAVVFIVSLIVTITASSCLMIMDLTVNGAILYRLEQWIRGGRKDGGKIIKLMEKVG